MAEDNMTDMEHMKFLKQVAENDVQELERKENTYRGSWKKRGGVGAFMMCARKWDRIEGMLCPTRMHTRNGVSRTADNYDIFEEIEFDPKQSGEDGSMLAEVRDLRRYLLLIEAEMISRAMTPIPRLDGQPWEYVELDNHTETIGSPADGGHHHRAIEDEVKVLERLDDGLKNVTRPQQDLYMSTQWNGYGFYIVDRRKVPQELWEHLPRMRTELNHKEYEESPQCYRSLYRWIDGESKWKMQGQYVDFWAKE
jgi:hypothetical protein